MVHFQITVHIFVNDKTMEVCEEFLCCNLGFTRKSLMPTLCCSCSLVVGDENAFICMVSRYNQRTLYFCLHLSILALCTGAVRTDLIEISTYTR